MYHLPSIELTIKINEVVQQNKKKLKPFLDRRGKMDFNIIVGMVLGAICSFHTEIQLKQIIDIFSPIFNQDQLKEYSMLIQQINNYFVEVVTTNPANMVVFEGNKWVTLDKAGLGPIYAFWYAFFGKIKVEFEEENNNIKDIQDNPIAIKALSYYKNLSAIMSSHFLNEDTIDFMQSKFPYYAMAFYELRLLLKSTLK